MCELDGITSTGSVIVVMEDVSDNAFDVDLLDDPLVKYICICLKFAVFFLCLSPPVCKTSGSSTMLESCKTFVQRLHFTDFVIARIPLYPI